MVFALLFIIYHSGGAAQDRMHSSRHFFAGKRAKQKETGKRPSLKENGKEVYVIKAVLKKKTTSTNG